MSDTKDNRSASQKIADLEHAMMSLYQTADNMARDLMTLKDAIKLLGNKVDSIVKASANGEPLNDTVIERIMVENNVEELRKKVEDTVAKGFLAPQEQVTEDSFVVGLEQDEQGKVIHPRIQFALQALQSEAVRNKIKGAKPGDVLDLEEGKLKFKVLETYLMQSPPAMAAVEAPSAETSAETSAESAAPAAQAADSSKESAAETSAETSPQYVAQ